jgi:hypothetical protein
VALEGVGGVTAWIDLVQTVLAVTLAPVAALAGVWITQRGTLKVEQARAEREHQARLADERRAAYAEFLGLVQRVTFPTRTLQFAEELAVARTRVSIVGTDAATEAADEVLKRVRELVQALSASEQVREEAWERSADAVNKFARVCRQENQTSAVTPARRFGRHLRRAQK